MQMLTASTLPRGSLRGISPQTTARSARHDCVLKNTNSQTFISDTVGNVLGSGEDSPTVWGKCRAATKGDGLCTACSPAGVQGRFPHCVGEMLRSNKGGRPACGRRPCRGVRGRKKPRLPGAEAVEQVGEEKDGGCYQDDGAACGGAPVVRKNQAGDPGEHRDRNRSAVIGTHTA